jgi:hypothetical protein
MEQKPNVSVRARRVAATAVLDAYREGRPIEELRTKLPEELEATGQTAAADVLRSFFRHPGLAAQSASETS